MNQYDYLFKFILIGDTGVGKSCILMRFIEDRFRNDHDATIGVEFGSKIFLVDNQTLKIQIWDTVRSPLGQSLGHTIKGMKTEFIKIYVIELMRSETSDRKVNTDDNVLGGLISSAICALAVYDVSKRSSFDNIAKWLADIKDQGNADAVTVIIGNKKDLDDKRQVSTQEGENFAKQNNCYFSEVSAKNGENIETIFKQAAAEILQRINDNPQKYSSESAGIKVGSKRPKPEQKDILESESDLRFKKETQGSEKKKLLSSNADERPVNESAYCQC